MVVARVREVQVPLLLKPMLSQIQMVFELAPDPVILSTPPISKAIGSEPVCVGTRRYTNLDDRFYTGVTGPSPVGTTHSVGRSHATGLVITLTVTPAVNMTTNEHCFEKV